MSAQRGQVVVGSNSWHYRVYQWFTRRYPNKWGYQENLCHYVRVVAIYAPLVWLIVLPTVWFVKQPLYRYLGYPIKRGIEMAIDAIIAFFEYMLEEGTRRKIFFILVTAPIWVPFVLVVALFALLFDHGLVPAIRWYATQRLYYWAARPWSVTLLVLILLSPILVGSEIVLEVFKNLVYAVGIGLGVISGVLLIYVYGKERYEQRQRLIVPTQEPRPSSIWQILWQYLVALKHKICPFIITPNRVEVQPA